MRAITLTQPWATLIVLGEKRVETRGPRFPQPKQGEQIAIHAAKGLAGLRGLYAGMSEVQCLRELCATKPYASALEQVAVQHATAQASLIAGADIPWESVLPRGAIVAVAHVQGVERADKVRAQIGEGRVPGYGTVAEHELAFGGYRPGNRLAIFLEHVTALLQPVTCPGALGLWQVPVHIERQVRRELHLAFERESAPHGDFEELLPEAALGRRTQPPALAGAGAAERDRTHASGGAA